MRIYVKAVVYGVEMERVEVERVFTFYRSNGEVYGYVLTWSNVPGGREADIKRLRVISTVIFGKPGNLKSNGKLLKYTRGYLEYAMRYEEIKEEIERWLE